MIYSVSGDFSRLGFHLRSCLDSKEYTDLFLQFTDRCSGRRIIAMSVHRLIISQMPSLRDILKDGRDMVSLSVNGGIPAAFWIRIVEYLYNRKLIYYTLGEFHILEKAFRDLGLVFPIEEVRTPFPGQEEEDDNENRDEEILCPRPEEDDKNKRTENRDKVVVLSPLPEKEDEKKNEIKTVNRYEEVVLCPRTEEDDKNEIKTENRYEEVILCPRPEEDDKNEIKTENRYEEVVLYPRPEEDDKNEIKTEIRDEEVLCPLPEEENEKKNEIKTVNRYDEVVLCPRPEEDEKKKTENRDEVVVLCPRTEENDKKKTENRYEEVVLYPRPEEDDKKKKKIENRVEKALRPRPEVRKNYCLSRKKRKNEKRTLPKDPKDELVFPIIYLEEDEAPSPKKIKKIKDKEVIIKCMGRNYICKICGRSIIGLSAFRQHEISHTIARPFRCDICGNAYIGNQRLRIHMKTHIEARPYNCPLCGESFIASCLLKDHTIKAHKEEFKEKTDENEDDLETLGAPSEGGKAKKTWSPPSPSSIDPLHFPDDPLLLD